jgi:hypothetical protein
VTEDLDDVDAVSFAAAVGSAAAGRLFHLLGDIEAGFDSDWLHGEDNDPAPGTFTRMVEFLASIESSNPETLWLEGQGRGWFEPVSWAQLPVGRRLVVSTFAHTAMDVYRGIVTPQKAAAADREQLRQAAAIPPLRREDSILEEEDRLDARVPGLEHVPGIDGAPKRLAERGASRAPVGQSGGKKSLSIGETNVRPPQNRGGRGRVKPEK